MYMIYRFQNVNKINNFYFFKFALNCASFSKRVRARDLFCFERSSSVFFEWRGSSCLFE